MINRCDDFFMLVLEMVGVRLSADLRLGKIMG